MGKGEEGKRCRWCAGATHRGRCSQWWDAHPVAKRTRKRQLSVMNGLKTPGRLAHMEKLHATNRARFNRLRHAKEVLHGRDDEWRRAAQEVASELCKRFMSGEDHAAYVMKLRQLLGEIKDEED